MSITSHHSSQEISLLTKSMDRCNLYQLSLSAIVLKIFVKPFSIVANVLMNLLRFWQMQMMMRTERQSMSRYRKFSRPSSKDSYFLVDMKLIADRTSTNLIRALWWKPLI